jgi:hypothetical protein
MQIAAEKKKSALFMTGPLGFARASQPRPANAFVDLSISVPLVCLAGLSRQA